MVLPEAPALNGEARTTRNSNWSGIKFFDGNPIPSPEVFSRLPGKITAELLREEKHVWRPEETLEAAKIFFPRGRIMVVGPPQSGKGTILFGLSDMCDLVSIGYVFIDGHHQEVPGEEVSQTLRQAEEKRIPIFYDSFDYLFLTSREAGRKISQEDQKKRIPVIMEALSATTVPVAVTFHDKEWQKEFLNQELVSQWAEILVAFPQYLIPLYLQSDASISRFLLDHQIPEAGVKFLLAMQTDSVVEEYLFTRLQDITVVKAVLSGLRTYPVLKELARDNRNLTIGLINKSISGDGEALHGLADLIYQLEEKRKILTQLRRYKNGKNGG